jgi:hypothetical protein
MIIGIVSLLPPWSLAREVSSLPTSQISHRQRFSDETDEYSITIVVQRPEPVLRAVLSGSRIVSRKHAGKRGSQLFFCRTPGLRRSG